VQSLFKPYEAYRKIEKYIGNFSRKLEDKEALGKYKFRDAYYEE